MDLNYLLIFAISLDGLTIPECITELTIQRLFRQDGVLIYKQMKNLVEVNDFFQVPRLLSCIN